MRPSRRVVGWVLALHAVGGLGLAAWSGAAGWHHARRWWASPEQTEGALEALGDYGEVPDFALTERSGRRVTRGDLLGTVWLGGMNPVPTEARSFVSLAPNRYAPVIR